MIHQGTKRYRPPYLSHVDMLLLTGPNLICPLHSHRESQVVEVEFERGLGGLIETIEGLGAGTLSLQLK